VHAHDVVTFADEDGIALRGGHHCNQPLMKQAGAHQHGAGELLRLQRGAGDRRLVTSMRRTLKFFGTEV
jgi:cysteine desulfurase/selenocysteine lyase